MGKIAKVLLSVAAGIVALVIVYFAFRALSSWNQGYSWQEMDWHQHGSTSLIDFFAASDIGKREVTRGANRCIEYYSYKDGLAVKTICSSDGRSGSN